MSAIGFPRGNGTGPSSGGGGGGGAPSGAAGGDLAGTYPNPTIGANKVVTAKILDANVTLAKLAPDAVSAFDAAGAASTALSAAILKSLVTAAGDLITATGSGTPARLAVGADGSFLFVNANGTLGYTILPILPRVDAATSSSLPAYTVGGAGATLTANANGAFPTVNGVTAAANQRYLLLNGASAVDNGLYTLTTLGDGSTPYVLTRHVRLAVGASAAGMFAVVRGGTQAGYVYYCSSAPGSDVVGTNSLTWALSKTQLTTEQDALYMHLAGAETITGDKTFTGVTYQNGARKVARTPKSADYTVGAADYLIEVDTTSVKLTVTAPDASLHTGRELLIANVAGSKRFKVTAVSGLVAGLTTFESLYLRQELRIVSDGTNWNSVGQGSGLLLDPAARGDVTIKTRFRGNSGITLVSSAVSDWAPRGAAAGYTGSAVQATAGNRPTITTGWSGDEDAVLFNGSSTYLATVAFPGGVIAQPMTLFAVCDINVSTDKLLYDGIDSSNRIVIDNNINVLTMSGGSSLSVTFSSPQSVLNNKRVLAAVYNGASSEIFHNGQRVAIGAGGSNSLAGLTIGARYSLDGFFWSGNIAEIVVCSGALSDWVVNRVSKFLVDYWQVPSVY